MNWLLEENGRYLSSSECENFFWLHWRLPTRKCYWCVCRIPLCGFVMVSFDEAPFGFVMSPSGFVMFSSENDEFPPSDDNWKWA